jgi:hypothetical protein
MEIELFTKPKGSYMICTVNNCLVLGQKPSFLFYKKLSTPSSPWVRIYIGGYLTIFLQIKHETNK